MTMELSDKARELRNAYQRAWRVRNPEKMTQYGITYWERKAEQYSPEMQARELHLKGYTQREIAEYIGVSVGTVNAWLNKD